MRLRGTAWAGTVVTGLLLAGQSVAIADGFGWVECIEEPATCELRAASPGENGSARDEESGDGGSLADCRFELAGSSARDEHEGRLGTWYYVLCPGKPVPQFPVFFPDGEPVLSPAVVARAARDRLVLPRPRIRLNPAGDQLVWLPTWLWLESWVPVSASASVPGVSVTALARPTSVMWVMGDGSRVWCGGPGTAYAEGEGNPAAPSPDCGHVYRRSSAGQPGESFTVTTTITWSVSWSRAGQSGTLPPLRTSASRTVRVVETQAINTDDW